MTFLGDSEMINMYFGTGAKFMVKTSNFFKANKSFIYFAPHNHIINNNMISRRSLRCQQRIDYRPLCNTLTSISSEKYNNTTTLRNHYKIFQSFELSLKKNGIIRFASTSTSRPPTTLPDNEFSAQLPTSSNFDENVEISVESLLNAPERIGYLKSLGLDWGWGPTSVMEYIMEHMHIYLGTPWWLTISLTAILVRVVLFKPYLASADNAAKMAYVNPIAKPVIDKMMAAQKAGDQAAFYQYKMEQSLIYKRAGIKPWKSGLPIIQMVLGFGSFRLINGMAKLPVPGLEMGGTLWFPNLAVADPYYILPMATAATLHWVMRIGGETGIQSMNPKMLIVMKWGFPFISLIFTSWLPSGVQLSFFISGLLSLTQAMLLREPKIRSYFQVTPVRDPTKHDREHSGSNSVRATNHVLTQSEISQRFQAPAPMSIPSSSSSSSGEAQSSNTPNRRKKLEQIFSGAVSDIKTTVNEVVETGRTLAGQTKEEIQGRLNKSELRERQQYEAKKQQEQQQALFDELRLRNLERQNRKRRS